MKIEEIEGNGKDNDLVNISEEGHEVPDQTEQGRGKCRGKNMLAESIKKKIMRNRQLIII